MEYSSKLCQCICWGRLSVFLIFKGVSMNNKFFAELKTNHTGTWVMCSDKLPPDFVDVLVFCSDTKEMFVGAHIGQGVFQYAYYDDTRIVCEPTHWAYLPLPPMQTTKVKVSSEKLYEFYTAYQKWLNDPDKYLGYKFSKQTGLKNNLKAYAEWRWSWRERDNLLREMQAQFVAAGRPLNFPFTTDQAAYWLESTNANCHTNPERIKWVDDRIKDYMTRHLQEQETVFRGEIIR